MRRVFKYLSLTFVFSIYLLTRLANINIMNEYVDYDEGTYLLIARLINHGFLPYRDIFAVHPPLYYYALAGWMRIFGDNFVVGRLLSVTLGFVAVVIAYFTGKKLNGWKLGVLFAAIIVLDPTFFRINMLVLHDTMVEAFTIASLYFFVRYITENLNLKWAYLSLVLAAIGSTVKFTIIPYLVALFIVIVLSREDHVWEYTKSAIDVLLSRKQLFVLLTVYLIITSVVVATVSAWPSDFTRKVIVVLGIHAPTVVAHQYLGLLIVVLWLIFTIYFFRCSYVSKLIYIIQSVICNWKEPVFMVFLILLSKVIIELPLGYLVSPEYLHQTYFSQGGRYPLFVGIFAVMSNIINNLKNESSDLVMGFVPGFVILSFILVAHLRGHRLKRNSYLAALLVLNMVLYLFVFPILPDLRFMNPMIIVFYLFSLDLLLSAKSDIPMKKVAMVAIFGILILGMVNYGLLVNYPQGKLDLIWATHTNELRDDAEIFLSSNSCGLTFSVNPMNAYSLGLPVDPEWIDSFGRLYLNKYPVDQFILDLNQDGTKCIILSTWMEAIMNRDRRLYEIYASIREFSIENGTLLFSESYSGDEFVSIFSILYPPRSSNFKLSSRDGKVVIWYNSQPQIYLYPALVNRTLSKNVISATYNNTFLAAWYGPDGSHVNCTIVLDNESVQFKTLNTGFNLEFGEGIVTDQWGEVLTENVAYKLVNIYVGEDKFIVMGERIKKASDGHLVVEGDITIQTG